jgi:hypothetical protein
VRKSLIFFRLSIIQFRRKNGRNEGRKNHKINHDYLVRQSTMGILYVGHGQEDQPKLALVKYCYTKICSKADLFEIPIVTQKSCLTKSTEMIVSKAGFEGLDVKEVLQHVFSYLSAPEIHAILLVSNFFSSCVDWNLLLLLHFPKASSELTVKSKEGKQMKLDPVDIYKKNYQATHINEISRHFLIVNALNSTNWEDTDRARTCQFRNVIYSPFGNTKYFTTEYRHHLRHRHSFNECFKMLYVTLFENDADPEFIVQSLRS